MATFWQCEKLLGVHLKSTIGERQTHKLSYRYDIDDGVIELSLGFIGLSMSDNLKRELNSHTVKPALVISAPEGYSDVDSES